MARRAKGAAGATPPTKKRGAAAASRSTMAGKKKGAAAAAKTIKISPQPYDPLSPSFAVKKILALDHLPSRSSVPPPSKTLTTVSDLNDLATSGMESLKRRLNLSHSEALKEIDASISRISKRIKVQTQECLQITEEAEKEYKTALDMITETTELAKASYNELMTEAQTTASRVSKLSIPELEKSLEKAVDYLRSRYRVPATQA